MRKIRSGIMSGAEGFEFREGFVGTGALIAGGALAAGGSVAGGIIQSNAAGDATKASTAAQQQSIEFQKQQAAKAEALQREFYNQSRADLEPFRQAQVQALGQLQGLADPSNPMYQQQRQMAQEQVQRQLAAQGLLRSTAQGDQLSNIEVGLANQRAQIIGGIAGNGAGMAQAGLAQGAGSTLANLYQQHAAQVGSSIQGLGQIQAAGSMAQGQALGGAFSGVGNALSGSLSNLYAQNQQQALLNRLFPQAVVPAVSPAPTPSGGGFGGKWGQY